MATDTPKTKKAFILRELSDAGLNTRHDPSIPGKPETMPDLEEGVFINYRAAGLVREATDDDLKGAAEAKPAKPAA